jgi:hexosaminidase
VGDLVTPLADPRIMKRTPGDQSVFATAGTRFSANGEVTDMGVDAVAAEVVPTPTSITAGAGTLDLGAGIALHADAIGAAAAAAALAHFKTLGIDSAASGVAVTVTVNAQDPAFVGVPTAEAYTLAVAADGVTIVGGDAAGAFYGLQTLAGLVPASGGKIPLTRVAHDSPRYAYRGVQIDIARNFHSVAELLKVIDQAAAYKLNNLHLHLSDDEGWRLEIPEMPELTSVAGRRCHDPSETTCILPQLGSGPTATTTGTGHLSTADFVQILKAAKARFITVVPEFDMPGHVRAAIKAMEVRAAAGDKTYLLSDPADKSVYLSTQYYSDNALNPCLDSTYAFIAKVMDEVAKMYTAAGATLTTWHVGGDEVGDGAWNASPACAALYATGGDVKTVNDVHGHFIRKVNALAQARGFAIRGWSDGLRKTVTGAGNTPTKVFLNIQSDLAGNTASVNWWGTLFWWDNSAYELANAGYKVILTSPDFLYLDHPYEADPKERGYYWATRYTDVKKLFSYISGNLPANSQISVDRQGFDYTSAFAPTATTPTPVIALTAPTNVVGLEGALFSETVRTDDNVDYMVFPRLLALAERAWHRADWEPTDGFLYTAPVNKAKLATDWQRFANVLGHKELAKLDKAQVAYRVEVPGAQIVNGTLTANVALPGLTIQYQQADGTWTAYDAAHPPALTKTQVRSVTASGRPGRAVAVP